jgi:nitroimidazol reductase NimA-like FMN-containing flavoprotein (pyridoxamine 5'-phosphate oxidase superfamily)
VGAFRVLYARDVQFPEEVCSLLEDERLIGHLATSLNDVPHVTPVWLDYQKDVEQLFVNVEGNTLKLRNVMRNPNVSISLLDPSNNAHWVVLRGLVTQVDDMGSDAAHLQAQARKHLGRPKRHVGHRFILRIKISHVRWWGGFAR